MIESGSSKKTIDEITGEEIVELNSENKEKITSDKNTKESSFEEISDCSPGSPFEEL